MKRSISLLSGWIYRYVAKPVLFKISPDSVHVGLVKTGKAVQSVGALRGLLKFSWAYRNDKMLGQKIAGVKLVNPVGLSAGFDNNFTLAPLLKSIGFGLMEGGSLTYLPTAGNPRPWFVRLPRSKSLVVNKGLANIGAEAIMRNLDKLPADQFKDFALNISVAKTNVQCTSSEQEGINDYCNSLKVIKKSGHGDMITINISCPNTFGGEPFTTPKMLGKLLDAVDQIRLRQPLFIKMPSYLSWDEFDALLGVMIKHKVAGVTVSNLAKDKKHLKCVDELPEGVRGGYSGKAVWDLSNNLIKRTYQKYGDKLVIIGVGGVFSAEDAYTKIKLGASLVELITGMIFEGPQLIGQINHDLAKMLERDGYSNISQAVGVDSRP